jgi:Holliday junction resolvase RusA-like endonuclease
VIKIEIPFRLPSLNDYVSANRGNKYGGNSHKQSVEDDILWCLKKIKSKISNPVRLKFIWYEQNKNRDKDNVAFAKKYILDALQKSGILPNDNNQYVDGFQDDFIYKQGDKVVVEIMEAKS